VHEVQRCSRAHPAASGSGACLSIPAVCTRERERIHGYIHISTCLSMRTSVRSRDVLLLPWCPLLPLSPLPYPHCAPDASWSRARRSADRDVNDRELRQGMGACGSTNGPPKIITIRLSENALATNRFEIDTIDKLCFKISWERSMLKFAQEITKINYHKNKIKLHFIYWIDKQIDK